MRAGPRTLLTTFLLNICAGLNALILDYYGMMAQSVFANAASIKKGRGSVNVHKKKTLKSPFPCQRDTPILSQKMWSWPGVAVYWS